MEFCRTPKYKCLVIKHQPLPSSIQELLYQSQSTGPEGCHGCWQHKPFSSPGESTGLGFSSLYFSPVRQFLFQNLVRNQILDGFRIILIKVRCCMATTLSQALLPKYRIFYHLSVVSIIWFQGSPLQEGSRSRLPLRKYCPLDQTKQSPLVNVTSQGGLTLGIKLINCNSPSNVCTSSGINN